MQLGILPAPSRWRHGLGKPCRQHVTSKWLRECSGTVVFTPAEAWPACPHAHATLHVIIYVSGLLLQCRSWTPRRPLVWGKLIVDILFGSIFSSASVRGLSNFSRSRDGVGTSASSPRELGIDQGCHALGGRCGRAVDFYGYRIGRCRTQQLGPTCCRVG